MLVYYSCTNKGSWSTHPEVEKNGTKPKAWSNYTTCVDVEDLNVSTTAYWLLLVCISLLVKDLHDFLVKYYVVFERNSSTWVAVGVAW